MADDAPLIVTASFADDVQHALDDLRRRFFPPERRHVGAHLTLFHALPGDAEHEVRAALADVTAAPRPRARVGEAFPLGRGVAVRVSSPDLERARTVIAARFADRLTRQDAARWRPHVTVQNKVEPAQARRTLAVVEAEHSPADTVVPGLALWRYRGGPWDLVTEAAFDDGDA